MKCEHVNKNVRYTIIIIITTHFMSNKGRYDLGGFT